LEKEVAEIEHTQKVQSTNFYLDAGARLRDPKKWTELREKQDKEVAEKQQKLQEARAKLDQLLEQARKLGIPTDTLQ